MHRTFLTSILHCTCLYEVDVPLLMSDAAMAMQTDAALHKHAHCSMAWPYCLEQIILVRLLPDAALLALTLTLILFAHLTVVAGFSYGHLVHLCRMLLCVFKWQICVGPVAPDRNTQAE